jgi:hypothetical protein
MGVLALGGSDCEALHGGWLGQPVNCVSSLAYVGAGVYVLRRSGPGPTPVAVAAALGAVGVGSVLYHGPMPAGAEAVHDGSLIALAATIMVTAGIRRSLPRPPAVALAAFGAALAINLLTRTGAPLCRPHSLAQGHAAWHVLTATALAAWLADRRPSMGRRRDRARP